MWGADDGGGAALRPTARFRIDGSGLTDIHDFEGTDGKVRGASSSGFRRKPLWHRRFRRQPQRPRLRLQDRSLDRRVHPAALFGSVPDDPSVPSFLAEGSDGNLYGTSMNGGVHDDGAVFLLDHAGNVTTLHTFENGVDGFGPGTMMQASTGDSTARCGTMRPTDRSFASSPAEP